MLVVLSTNPVSFAFVGSTPTGNAAGYAATVSGMRSRGEYTYTARTYVRLEFCSGPVSAAADDFRHGAHQVSRHHTSAGGERLVLQARDDDHLVLGDVGHAVAHHVVDLQPEERRGTAHLDACPRV